MKRWGLASIEEMHRNSVERPDWFWRAAAEELGVPLRGEIAAVRDETKGRAFPRWFTGATLNVVESCVERHAADAAQRDRPAIIYEGDSGQHRGLTFAELKREVDLFAGALQRLGVRTGDRIALFMPPQPEAAVALFGAAKIGAIVVPAFSGYGSEALATRLDAAQVSIVVVADATTRRGKPVPMKEIADGAVARSPSVRHMIVLTNTDAAVPMTPGRDHRWDDLRRGEPHAAPPMALDPNHPLFIIYTSGTTGAPKGIVHSHVGYLLKSAIDFGFAFDLQGDDVLGWIADMGWMLGPLMIVGGLHLGSSLVMIEGLPDYPGAERLWEIVARNHVTLLGVAPTAARGLRTKMAGAKPAANLSSLRAFASTGEAWDLPTWQWLFEDVGRRRLPVLNYSGGTETGGGILSCYTILPQSPASFCGPLPGMDVDVLDAEGRPTTGIGELVLRNTWPGMAHGFWRADARYLETYWSRWPDVWVHGDLASVDADGYWHIHGRSDDTLKIGGRRVGPAEIESALVGLAGVAEAAVIGVPDPIRGQRVVAFVSPRGDVALDPAELLADVTAALGKGMAPSAIHVVGGLPKTRNGKIMRRAIRARHLGERAGDLSALDPAIPLDEIPAMLPIIEIN
ncbi:AMP-binding protein [Sphingomonas sp. CL5.1]|uniref:AMP-binding protein n=1 Tax=Sphingomonas sp. CL5.1 TaxID=2653203 RepID=UPI001C2E1306|nr:AMP-binding protein [Sphingomonas sp. CL5.1]